MSYVIDPETGLPRVPEGFRWKIGESWFVKDMISGSLQKKTFLGWRTVASGDTLTEYLIRDEAVTAHREYFNRREIAARRRAERLARKSLYGVYPPKKLENSW